jgi:ABC-type transporter Mla subunit MlaD
MDISKILEELRAEREQVEMAIISLERLGAAQGKRRGRPPKWMSEANASTEAVVPKRRGRPPGSGKKSAN